MDRRKVTFRYATSPLLPFHDDSDSGDSSKEGTESGRDKRRCSSFSIREEEARGEERGEREINRICELQQHLNQTSNATICQQDETQANVPPFCSHSPWYNLAPKTSHLYPAPSSLHYDLTDCTAVAHQDADIFASSFSLHHMEETHKGTREKNGSQMVSKRSGRSSVVSVFRRKQ